MADEQDRAERLDDEKFDDVPEDEPALPLVDNTADADAEGEEASPLDEDETGDELEGTVGEGDDDPAPDYYGAGVPAEEAAMHVEEG